MRLVVKAQQAPGDWRYLVTSLRTDLSGLGRSDFDFRAQLAQLDQIERNVAENEQYYTDKLASIEDKAMQGMRAITDVRKLVDDAIDSLEATSTSGYEEPGALDRHIRAAIDDLTTAKRYL